jgi:hypothetical protein
MTKQTKILLGVGVIVALYLYLKPKKAKRSVAPTQSQPNNSDPTRSAYNIVPLPDIKGVQYASVMPMQVVGQTTSSPIIIATKKM